MKFLVWTLFLALFFTGCSVKEDVITTQEKKQKPKNELLENAHINDTEKLEVSNNLLQVLPAITITGVNIVLNDKENDTKPILLKNDKCIFMGEASSDVSNERVKIELKKASCRTSFQHKVNYNINGWVADSDKSFALKVKKDVIFNEEKESIEKTTLSIKNDRNVYLVIDSVTQIETILVNKKTKLINIK